MEKPINFLTASGGDLFDYFYSLQTHYATSYRAIAILRDEIAAAVEAKVRGECADTLRDMESASHGYRRSSEEWQRRAERAEADANEVREAFKRVSIEMDRAERRQREMVGGCAAKGCPHRPTPPLAHGPDHAQARALALQVVPPTAYHAQFSVEQRAAYNLAQAYLALATRAAHQGTEP